MASPLLHRDHRAVILWLSLCALLVACMVMLGGYTRLSGSGLSITAWKPVHGIVPPLDEVQWEEEFAAYRASPQYAKVNIGMTLPEFKSIYWPEYLHRLLGRAVGVVFLLPMLAFVLRRSISARMVWRMGGIFALGGLQGLIGWLMVKSGLVDQPYVNPLRLALHLGVAFAIFGMLVWTIIEVVSEQWSVARKSFVSLLTTAHWSLTTYLLWLSLLILQILLGALVAGTHAGFMYNSWPDMNGRLVPGDLMAAGLSLQNLPLIQFVHRTIAVLVTMAFLFWWRRYRVHVKKIRGWCASLAAALLAQFALGVLTLVHVVPLPLAMLHQLGGLVVFGIAIGLLHAMSSSGLTRG